MTDCTRVGDVRLLWHDGYWDGPLNGLAHHNGRDYYFAVEEFDPDDPPAEWRYFLYPLTDEELEDEREAHRFFGDHEYDANGVETIDMNSEMEQPDRQALYEKFCAKTPKDSFANYTSRPPIAWFTWNVNRGGTYI